MLTIEGMNVANIANNEKLRQPQIEFFEAVQSWYNQTGEYSREVSVILPTGAGKTGCIAIAHLAVSARRTLIIAPWIAISDQIHDQLVDTNLTNFYRKYDVLADGQMPKVVHWKSGAVPDLATMAEARIVVTNIQQLVTQKNGLNRFPRDFFDLILVDESHHNTARSWRRVKEQFDTARIINFSATPERSDGKIMHGTVIYAYTIAESIMIGYCKSIIRHLIQPESMQVIRNNSEQVDNLIGHQAEALGGASAAFRRAVYTEEETTQSIIAASLDIWRKKIEETGETKLKIIVAAANVRHCEQLVKAYEKNGVRAGCVHHKQTPEEKALMFFRIANHEVDVVVQVRMLNEGFDHAYFGVAAIFASFGSLLPFYQFIGRTMRCLKEGEPGHPLNEATVVIHGATNQVDLWDKLKALIDAGKDYYNGLVSKVPHSTREVSHVNRRPAGDGELIKIIAQQLGIAHSDQLVSFETMFNRLITPFVRQNMTKEQIGSIITSALSSYFAEDPPVEATQ